MMSRTHLGTSADIQAFQVLTSKLRASCKRVSCGVHGRGIRDEMAWNGT